MNVKDLAARYEAAAKEPEALPERAPVPTEKVRELRAKLERAVETVVEKKKRGEIVGRNVAEVKERFEGDDTSDKDEKGDVDGRDGKDGGDGEDKEDKSIRKVVLRTGEGEGEGALEDGSAQVTGRVEEVAERFNQRTEQVSQSPVAVSGRREEGRDEKMQDVVSTSPFVDIQLQPFSASPSSTVTPPPPPPLPRQPSIIRESPPPPPAITSQPIAPVASSSPPSTPDGSFSVAYSDSSFGPIIPPSEITDVDDLDHIDGVERVDDVCSAASSAPTVRRNATVEILSEPNGVGEFSGDDEDGFKDAPHVQHSSDTASRPSPAIASRPSMASKFSAASIPEQHARSSELSSSASMPSTPSRRSSSESTSRRSVESSQRGLQKHGTITSVEDDLSSSGSFMSAGSDFPHTAPAIGRGRRRAAQYEPASMRQRLDSTATSTMRQRLDSTATSTMRQRLDSTATATTHRTAGSFRLPKAKVMIARKRGQSANLDAAAESTDDMEDGARKLVRVYENPKDLISGQVSMVDILSDQGDEEEEEKIAVEKSRKDMIGGGALVPRRKENVFRKRYDEFLDAEQLGQRPLLSDEDPTLDPDETFADKGASKQRYRHRFLFGGKTQDKKRTERAERHAENVQRRSTMLSGALDRVSMAADPWIDFITDNPAARQKRPWNVMKRLFKRRGNDLIKD